MSAKPLISRGFLDKYFAFMGLVNARTDPIWDFLDKY
jgi:hypothetical protein